MKTLSLFVVLFIVGCNKPADETQNQPANTSAQNGVTVNGIPVSPGESVTVPGATVTVSPSIQPFSPSDQLPPENLKQEAVAPIPGATFNGPRLGDIPVGKTVWINYWTVWVASPGDGLPNKTFVNGYHPYFESQQPNTIQITREDNGWVVDLHGATQEWTAMKFPGIQGGSYDSQPVRFRH